MPDRPADRVTEAAPARIGPKAPFDRPLQVLNALERATAATAPEDVCPTCDGDGYTEAWNADQSDVVITLCTDCGPGPGDFDA